MARVPLSILIPAKNEEQNIARCLEPIFEWADEVVIVDSQSTDRTVEIAARYGCTVLQFRYGGGWPKKRQWALDTYNFRNDWILLLDSDEILLEPVKQEITQAIQNEAVKGYWLRFQIYFLGKQLKYGNTALWKLSLFRRGYGRYEKRLEAQDASMADMEIHEHVLVDGKTAKLQQPVRHENYNALDRYITKHNEYSNWEAHLLYAGAKGELEPSLFGNQAQQRRFLKKLVIRLPLAYVLRFLFLYFFKLGFLDGRPGFIHAGFKAVQYFHIQAKLFELEQRNSNS